MSRRKGRILAVQALYSYDVGKVPLDDLLKLQWIQEDSESDLLGKEIKIEENEKENVQSASKQESCDFARIIIAGTINNLDVIDDKIKSHLTGNWDFSRLNRVTLAIIRISVYALLFQKDISHTIVIDEAISMSKQFGSDDSFKFINAILDSIYKDNL